MSSTLISIQVGLPRIVPSHDGNVATGIFKHRVEERVEMRTLNLDGDRQADLTVHGGQDKAVYGYPSEHYPYWKTQLPGIDLPWGSFGENLTTSGLDEKTVHIGDRFAIGGAEVVVTQPRLPCFKLNLKFGREDMVRRFLASHRSGFYFRVLREGEVGAGDEIIPIHQDENRVSVRDIVGLYLGENNSRELRERALRVEHLAKVWRDDLTQQA